MDLLARVIRPGGLLSVVVPHFSNPYFYSDYSHRGFFGLYSFSYLVSDNIHRRKVPTYGREISFELSLAELIFKSSPPFYVRYAFQADSPGCVQLEPLDPRTVRREFLLSSPLLRNPVRDEALRPVNTAQTIMNQLSFSYLLGSPRKPLLWWQCLDHSKPREAEYSRRAHLFDRDLSLN